MSIFIVLNFKSRLGFLCAWDGEHCDATVEVVTRKSSVDVLSHHGLQSPFVFIPWFLRRNNSQCEERELVPFFLFPSGSCITKSNQQRSVMFVVIYIYRYRIALLSPSLMFPYSLSLYSFATLEPKVSSFLYVRLYNFLIYRWSSSDIECVARWRAKVISSIYVSTDVHSALTESNAKPS